MKTMTIVILISFSLSAIGFSQSSFTSQVNGRSTGFLVTTEAENNNSESYKTVISNDVIEKEVQDGDTKSSKLYGFDYFPLNTDVSYVYDSNAGETESDVTVNGEELVLTFDSGKMSYQQQFYKGKDGIYLTKTASKALLFFGKNITYPDPVLRIPLPLEIGSKWTWKGLEVAEGDTGKLTISGEALGEETIKTPIAEYHCLKIQLKINSEHGSKNTVTEWLAPGIGVVKFHAALEGRGLTAFLQDIFGFNEITFDLKGIHDNNN